jgi:1,4-alpha-glucan branching enzyme
MSIKKRYLKSRPMCKVTFRLDSESAQGAQHVAIVGEFNDWDIAANPMKGLKSGEFTTTLELEVGREYQFRYLIDRKNWQNDGQADKYTYSAYANCENSVVVV